MKLDESSVELDLAVANAVGIEVGQWPDGWPYDGAVYRKDDSPAMQRSFCPSSDMTDAWEAAEKVGLFKVHYDAGGRPWRWRLIQGIEMGKWLLNPMYVDECKEVEGVKDPRHFEEQPGPLAICAAILKLEEPA